jgi:hypothetical protein
MGDSHLRIYVNSIEAISSEKKYKGFLKQLIELFPEQVSPDQREPFIPLNMLESKFIHFQDLIISLKQDQ